VKVITVAAAALFDAQGRVLMAERPPGGSMAGLWEFPGGKIEAGETPEAALAREIDEELGVTIESPAPLGFVSHGYPAFHLLMLLYGVRRWQGTPQGRLGQQLQWVDATQLDALAMPAADYPLIPAVRAAAMMTNG
jgi:8-oxo-dGTP diphosphatase